MKYGRTLAALMILSLVAACSPGSDPPRSAKKQARAIKIAKVDHQRQTRPAAKQPAVEQAGPELAADDFKESGKRRDPFRKDRPKPPPDPKEIQTRAVADQYALDELKLIAVVTGKVQPTAMFRSPRGRGYTVYRGQRISSSHARVKRILDDRVVLEIAPEAPGAGVAEKVLMVARRKAKPTEDTWSFSDR